MSYNIQPIEGAAQYSAEMTLMGWAIVMTPHDGGPASVIDRRKGYEAAIKCADNWQKKENKAVTKFKSQKS